MFVRAQPPGLPVLPSVLQPPPAPPDGFAPVHGQPVGRDKSAAAPVQQAVRTRARLTANCWSQQKRDSVRQIMRAEQASARTSESCRRFCTSYAAAASWAAAVSAASASASTSARFCSASASEWEASIAACASLPADTLELGNPIRRSSAAPCPVEPVSAPHAKNNRSAPTLTRRLSMRLSTAFTLPSNAFFVFSGYCSED